MVLYCGVWLLGPCLYSTDYNEEYNLLSLQFNDILSSLGNYNYTYLNEKQSIVSFYRVIKHIISQIDTNELIKNVYVHNAKKINDTTDLLNISILDRNF